jgi:hypothetical protein
MFPLFGSSQDSVDDETMPRLSRPRRYLLLVQSRRDPVKAQPFGPQRLYPRQRFDFVLGRVVVVFRPALQKASRVRRAY